MKVSATVGIRERQLEAPAADGTGVAQLSAR